jgi:hypothetical protein
MNNDDILNKESKESKESSELIDKLYSNKDNTKKDISPQKHTGVTNLNTDKESDKYIKEMHVLADKNEFRNNVVFLGLGLVIVSIIVFSIVMNTSFMKPKTEVAVTKPVTKTTTDTTQTKAKVADPTVITSTKTFEYLNIESNRSDLLNRSIKLNKGSKNGLTVLLLSETLRSNGVAINANTSTVKQLMDSLTSMDWKKNRDATKLQKGDICFTTDMPGKTGVPSHAYIFMGWVKDGNTDYANICDGQIEEFDSILHKRNLSITTTEKDKFSFFLKK